MTTQDFTPKESFELISKVINEAKTKFEENGTIYIMWGLLIALASFSQHILLQKEFYSIHYYPYFIMPVGAIVTWVYYYRKEKSRSNQLSIILAISWGAIALNLMILGFFFANTLQSSLVPILLLLVGIGFILLGSTLRSNLILVSGILINISGFVCFKLDTIYHSLLMGIVSVLFILIPAILLKINYNKKNV